MNLKVEYRLVPKKLMSNLSVVSAGNKFKSNKVTQPDECLYHAGKHKYFSYFADYLNEWLQLHAALLNALFSGC